MDTRITDSQLNEIDAMFADLEWIDFKRPVWKAVKARLMAAEVDADRLAEVLRMLWPDEPELVAENKAGANALRLHDEALVLREPS